MATSQYNAFIRLLKDTEVTSQVDSGRRRAGDGLTVLAPTDAAFAGLRPPGALNRMDAHRCTRSWCCSTSCPRPILQLHDDVPDNPVSHVALVSFT
jgi:hypothetical protein